MPPMLLNAFLVASALIASTTSATTPFSWSHPLPRVLHNQPLPGDTNIRTGAKSSLAMPDVANTAGTASPVLLAKPMSATVILGHFAINALPGTLATMWAQVTRPLTDRTGQVIDGVAHASGLLSDAWVTLASREDLPDMVGSVEYHGLEARLVLSPARRLAVAPGVLPVCADYEGIEGDARRQCGLVEVTGGHIALPGAAADTWVVAHMPTPGGPRLTVSPELLARGLHVAARMPANARTVLAEDIEVSARMDVIDEANCIAAMVAIDFAARHFRPATAAAG